MTTNHTPGPWIAEEVWDEDGDSMGLISVDAGRYQVCQIKGIGFQDFDNARLIASAPDLLAALDELANYVPEYDRDTIGYKIVQRARAAIARAKGQ